MIDKKNSSVNSVQLKLLTQVSQELLTPMTSILGMAAVLNQEIYGPLTSKQKEYVDIINERSRYLRSLVEEVIALAKLATSKPVLDRKATNVETLCQQIVSNLESEASQHQVKIQLSMQLTDTANSQNSGSSLMLFDRAIVQQMLHNLLLSAIQSADADSTVQLYVCRKTEALNMVLWTYHPLLGERLPHAQVYSQKLSALDGINYHEERFPVADSKPNEIRLPFSELANLISLEIPQQAEDSTGNSSTVLLRLLLSCQLLEMHGGYLSIQGLSEERYRYVLSFPRSTSTGAIGNY